MKELTFHNAEAIGETIGKCCHTCQHKFGWHEWIFVDYNERLFCSEQCADTDEDIARAEMMEGK